MLFMKTEVFRWLFRNGENYRSTSGEVAAGPRCSARSRIARQKCHLTYAFIVLCNAMATRYALSLLPGRSIIVSLHSCSSRMVKDLFPGLLHCTTTADGSCTERRNLLPWKMSTRPCRSSATDRTAGAHGLRHLPNADLSLSFPTPFTGANEGFNIRTRRMTLRIAWPDWTQARSNMCGR